MKLDLAGSRKRPRLVFSVIARRAPKRSFRPGQASPPSTSIPMRILIVDDEPGIRKTTRIAIESAGHEAAEAGNAARALKAVADESFDAVFLDLKLGADDGIDTLGKLLKAQPTNAMFRDV